MAKLWRRSTAGNEGRKLDEISFFTLRIDRPTVIFLPGIFTTDKNNNGVTEGLAQIEALLKAHSKATPQILGLSHKNLSNVFNLAAYNRNPQKTCGKAAWEFADAAILPLVTKDGKPLPLAEAARNLRNLTLLGYSAGTVFAQEMYNASLPLMKNAGYTEEDAKGLLKEVVLISLATVSRPTREPSRFTTVYLAGTNDLAVRIKNRLWRPLSRLFSSHSQELVLRELSDTSVLITANIGGNMWEIREGEKAPITPLICPRSGIKSNHELPHYLTCDDDHNAFSQVAKNTLVNALGRTQRMPPLELIKPANDDAESIAKYEQRIQSARARAPNKSKTDKSKQNKRGK